MSTTAEISEPASELERLIADLPGSGLLAFVFGVGWWVAHLKGVTTPLFRGPADRCWWHVELGDDVGQVVSAQPQREAARLAVCARRLSLTDQADLVRITGSRS